MSKLPLYDYQEDISKNLIENYEKNRNTLITLPTGTGKSRTIIETLKTAVKIQAGTRQNP